MGPVRAFVPLIAGITAMKAARFQTANIGSALIWVPVMLAPGYLAGKGVTVLGGDGHTMELLAGAVVLTVAVLFVAKRMLMGRTANAPPAS
jgi:membrane protein DedA with SNARE-associated domain